ncbi:MAG: MOSC domain-containing protein [Hyphomicrobium sp.]|uniref:MOSC domain-containing protein n=1 Tax=Hyphomicrobium sp. TaxID=82 RepID=UPI00132ABF7D|nr:MOSC domain-containing protein [Hyphomicrobium sp.]KAB2940649.1 MAG: MOSC domain-containing protein [Hyphomicrobium sp.]MBZ0211028.1 MOSC domain-containing protein [Hyphomicrobium sp.]
MSGRLIGIARREARRAQMQTVDSVEISVETGVSGDHKGAKFKRRAVTILAREDWEAALADLGANGEAVALNWTARRANLLVEGVRLPRAIGATLRIGPVLLEVTYPTTPCARMDEAHAGLRKVLHPEWRGGVTCKVLEGGRISIGDDVTAVHSPPERQIRLPG